MATPSNVNVSQLLGRHREWRNGVSGNAVTGYAWYVPHSFTGGMPINIRHKRSGGKWVSGGPWLMWKDEVFLEPSSSTRVFRLGNKCAYEGGFNPSFVHYAPAPADWNTTNGLDSRRSALTNRGAEAWNRLRPDKPDFSFATSVYELKDFVPLLKEALKRVIRKVRREQRRRRRRGRSQLSAAGQYYLAINFGYLPLLRDIRNFVKAQRGSQRRLDQLIRDNGRPIRRRAKISASSVTTNSYSLSEANSNMVPVLVTQCYASGGTREIVRRTTRELCWAAGRFRYLLPRGPRTVAWRRKMLRRIMGGRITPSALYQVIPWSWLADYFTDLGQFIDAVSPGVADRLVADYAYIMNHLEWETITERSQYVYTDSSGAKGIVACKATSLRTIKMRVNASPFGFGLKQGDLSSGQVAILGALGLSRLP